MLFSKGINVTAVLKNNRTVTSVCIASWDLVNTTPFNAKSKVASSTQAFKLE